MRRFGLYIAAAVIFMVSARVDPASVAHAEALLAGGVSVIAASDSLVSSRACLRLGACVNKTIHTATPAISEDYPDGLQWGHDSVSFKFSGNRVKFRLHF
jgi:hypothetical protein